MTRQAVVSRINHDDGTIDAYDYETGVIEDIPYDGFPPAPLSTVRLIDGPTWRVDRQLGPIRQLFYDDFTEGRSKIIAYSERTSDSGGVVVETNDISVTATLESGRRYRVEAWARAANATNNAGGYTFVKDGATRIGLIEWGTLKPSNAAWIGHRAFLRVGDGVSQTFYLGLNRWLVGSAYLGANADEPCWIALYDDGPVSVGDTSWIVSTTAPGPGGGTSGINNIRPATLDDAHGVIELNNTISGEDLFIRKSQTFMVPPSDRALWLSARWQLHEDATNIVMGLGSSAGGGTEYVNALAQSVASTVYLESRLTAAIDTVDSGTAFATEEWQIIDVVLIAGLYAALWVNGDGPWIITDPTRLPAEGADMYPYLGTIGEGGADPVYLDWYHVQEFAYVNAPDDFALAGVESVG